MDWKNKYIKYKNKYLEQKNVNNKNKINIKQKAGTFILYPEDSRLDLSCENLLIQSYVMLESIRYNRFFHRYHDFDGELKSEGIDPAWGPGGEEHRFEISEYVKNPIIDVDMYESFIIYDYLVKINNYLNKFGIKSCQSQISYYCKDILFFDKNYLQNPFISYSGPIESIPIMKKMMEHPLAKDLLFYSHYRGGDELLSASGLSEYNKSVYITFARPFFDQEDKFIFIFDDREFWIKMLQIAFDMDSTYSSVESRPPMFVGNDPDLDMSKDWYVVNDQRQVVKIEDKTRPNPYSIGLPLTTLNVRYEPDLLAFKEVFSTE